MNPGGTVTGRFSCEGYEVLLDGQQVYAAGSNPHDSTASAEPGHGLSLPRIAEFCERTAREIAAETGAVFGDIEEEGNT
jgi:hypothetical protein